VKSWLTALVENLDAGPVLALAAVRRLARAAVFSPEGELWAGSLGSPALTAQAAAEAAQLEPGDCRLRPEAGLSLERLRPDEETRRFWLSALEDQAGTAWASWLLTMPCQEPEGPRLSRHLLSAFGPWTTPRLPEPLEDQWSLLPLKAGLGRLFVLGDDALALEVTWLAARAGLTVTWLTAQDQRGPELDEARALSDFGLERVQSWPELTAGRLRELGLREGVRLLVTTPEHEAFWPELQEGRKGDFVLAGEAEEAANPSGPFPGALTTAQKALGLVAGMLRR
jgi:hypothetical protein